MARDVAAERPGDGFSRASSHLSAPRVPGSRGKESPPSLFTAFPVVALAAVAVAGGLYAGETVVTALGTLFLTAVGLAWGWAALGVWRVSAASHLESARLFPGEDFRHRFRLTNGKPWPAFLEIRFAVRPRPVLRGGVPEEGLPSVSPPVGCGSRFVFVPPMGTREFPVTWTAPARGVYRAAATLVGADPWGWFQVSRRIGEDERLWVYPRVYPVTGLPLPRRESPDGSPRGRGRWANRLFYAGVRGDGRGSLQDVDWRATARFQRLQFKEYAAGSERGLHVLLDVGRPRSALADPDPIRAAEAAARRAEAALSLAASLLWERFQAGDSVGFGTNARTLDGGGQPPVHRIRTLPEFQRLLEAMAELVWESPLDWSAVLPRLRGVPPGVTPVVVGTRPLPLSLLAYAYRHRAWVLLPQGVDRLGAEDGGGAASSGVNGVGDCSPGEPGPARDGAGAPGDGAPGDGSPGSGAGPSPGGEMARTAAGWPAWWLEYALREDRFVFFSPGSAPDPAGDQPAPAAPAEAVNGEGGAWVSAEGQGMGVR